MPGFLLHHGAVVLCAHGGQAQPTLASPRVRVSGQPVVTQALPYTIGSCPFTLPSGTQQPCLTAQWVTAAARVQVMGQPVLLQDSQAICSPNGTPVTIALTQARVKGM
jgi:hypothetical protein